MNLFLGFYGLNQSGKSDYFFFEILYLLKIMITIIGIIITTTKNGNNNNNNSNNVDDNNNNNNNNLARIFCDDIGMEFEIDKCATLVLKRWKITKFDGILCLMENTQILTTCSFN